MKHITIPIFIPEIACPFQCLYCNQKKISGNLKPREDSEIHSIIDSYLKTISRNESKVELGFFGGNFTGINCDEQKHYLELVQLYLEKGLIDSIRLSTRPDYIDQERLDLLKKHGVKSIELGAQSMDEEVLKRSGRGHMPEDVIKASKLIKQNGFDLGLQMMIGLPGDSKQKAIDTATQIINLGADDTRIYPTLVIKDTTLEQLYCQDKYEPLSLKESVSWTAELIMLFEEAKVNILRVGLHPSEGLTDGKDLIAGPFHNSFKELALTEIWKKQFKNLNFDKNVVEIIVNHSQLNHAVGYESSNKKWLQTKFDKVYFKIDLLLKGREFHVNYR